MNKDKSGKLQPSINNKSRVFISPVTVLCLSIRTDTCKKMTKKLGNRPFDLLSKHFVLGFTETTHCVHH